MELKNEIAEAVRALQQGGVIAYPTESVFGLGCDPENTDAVQHILELKQRSPDQGLILVASSFEQLEHYLLPVETDIQQRVFASWPGPHTWLWPVRDDVSRLLRGQHTTLAVRVSAHPVVQALCQGFNKAIVSTSANPTNMRPACTPAEVRQYFAARLAYTIDARVGDSAQPTKIRDALTNTVLRA